MKTTQIEVGRTYQAKVSGVLVPLTVLSIDVRETWGGKSAKRYRCHNERTGREIVVKSAQRFRYKTDLRQATQEQRLEILDRCHLI